MHFHFFIQSFSQLDNVYGKEVAQIILDNCGLTYLKTNTHTLIDTALFQSSASILMTCILFFFVGALLIITGYIINKQPIDKTKIKNTLNWKEEYKNEELNIKIINELENAHAAVQELRQQIEELKKRENGTN